MRLLARPWVDPLCLWGMGRLLPASHLWAAASKAQGDGGEFSRLIGMKRVPARLARRLARTDALRRESARAQALWERAAFEGEGDLAADEASRRLAAQSYLGHRFTYLVLAGILGAPSANFEIPAPRKLRRKLSAALSDPDRYFLPPDPAPVVEQSRAIDHGDAIEYWLRFPSVTETSPDRAIIHVYEPKHVSGAEPPSLIFCHGLAMEVEMLARAPRDFIWLARAGIRVLLPDAPGHNRRCPPGLYGGESFIARGPASALRDFRQAAVEFATIIAWCKTRGNGLVALGGISLGALSAQVASSRWRDWPASARADALFLVTTTDEVSTLAVKSSLGRVAGLDEAARKAGWTDVELAALSPLTDAAPEPPIDPERIVLVLGARDNVTPIMGGRRLMEKWRVPAPNLFLRDQGHFSAAIGLNADPAPFARMLEILKA